MNPSPWTLGTEGFIWAITIFADSTAALLMSTLAPRETNPWPSGGDTFMKATSIFLMPFLNSAGISERKQGR